MDTSSNVLWKVFSSLYSRTTHDTHLSVSHTAPREVARAQQQERSCAWVRGCDKMAVVQPNSPVMVDPSESFELSVRHHSRSRRATAA
jgi:hypothetical protein